MFYIFVFFFFFFSSRRRHTRLQGDWSSDVCSSDLIGSVDCNELKLSTLTVLGRIVNRAFEHIPLFTIDFDAAALEGNPRHITICVRSEERRVGKECRSRWSQEHEKKKMRENRNTDD